MKNETLEKAKRLKNELCDDRRKMGEKIVCHENKLQEQSKANENLVTALKEVFYNSYNWGTSNTELRNHLDMIARIAGKALIEVGEEPENYVLPVKEQSELVKELVEALKVQTAYLHKHEALLLRTTVPGSIMNEQRCHIKALVNLGCEVLKKAGAL